MDYLRQVPTQSLDKTRTQFETAKGFHVLRFVEKLVRGFPQGRPFFCFLFLSFSFFIFLYLSFSFFFFSWL